MCNDIDIRENHIRSLSSGVLELLLSDRPTGRHIVWATHDYEALGADYGYRCEIQPQLITGERGMVIRPRVVKSREEQAGRVRGMAEVFTPAWVVRRMVEAVDIDVATRCLELTCGEAPFLVSRYDATTGAPIAIGERIGVLDRKLRLIDQRQLGDDEWLAQVRLAFQTTYGYEWQGDSLLLARENLLYTFVDHYEARFGIKPDVPLLKVFADIISWNLWQMDGLNYCIPREKSASQPTQQTSLFTDAPTEAPPPFCLIKDWQKAKTLKVIDIKNKTRNTMKFDVIIGNPPYQEEQDGDNKTYNPPVYDRFMSESYNVADVVELIHPARFLFNAGSTKKDWNKRMLNDPHLKVMFYDPDSSNVFLNTDIKGGIAVTLHNNKKSFRAIGTFTPFDELNSIKIKVEAHTDFSSMESIVVSAYAYHFSKRLHTEITGVTQRLSKGHAFDLKSNVFEKLPDVFFEQKPNDGQIYAKVFGLIGGKRVYRYIKKDYLETPENFLKYKVLMPAANGSGAIGEVLSTPLIGEPLIGETETFISIGSFDTFEEASALLKYVKTKFSRALLGILKVTQHITPEKWRYVPLQDFTSSSDIDWSKSIAEIDEQLFDKYGMDEQERNFIRTKVKEMK